MFNSLWDKINAYVEKTIISSLTPPLWFFLNLLFNWGIIYIY